MRDRSQVSISRGRKVFGWRKKLHLNSDAGIVTAINNQTFIAS